MLPDVVDGVFLFSLIVYFVLGIDELRNLMMDDLKDVSNDGIDVHVCSMPMPARVVVVDRC